VSPTATADSLLIAYDGSPSSEQAVIDAGALFHGRRAVVVVVWEPDVGFELVEGQAISPAPLDLRTAVELDEALYEGARLLAERGARLAERAGLVAEPLAVADDRSVADTLVRIAKEQNAVAVVIGAHGHRGIRELLLGSTSYEVVHRAACPVVVVRKKAGRD
jgi:nucleotide-binding universal stress UspA family protein